MTAIPVDASLQLCREIVHENAQKWYTLRAMQCWGCMLFSEGPQDCLCMDSPQGCSQVNDRYARRVQDGTIFTPHP